MITQPRRVLTIPFVRKERSGWEQFWKKDKNPFDKEMGENLQQYPLNHSTFHSCQNRLHTSIYSGHQKYFHKF